MMNLIYKRNTKKTWNNIYQNKNTLYYKITIIIKYIQIKTLILIFFFFCTVYYVCYDSYIIQLKYN